MRALALAAAALALAVPSASAAGFDTIFKDFKQDGKIEPCRYSASELATAKKDVPRDIEQYAPEFPDALQASVAARAKGSCTKTPAAATAAAPAATTPTTPAPP